MKKIPFAIAPSLLSADFGHLRQQLRAVEQGGAAMIHLDVMDGHFVPNLTLGPLLVRAVRRLTRLPLDVHLMIEQPERYIRDFAEAGADLISVHPEATPHIHRALQMISSLNKKAGVALNPGTPLAALEHLLGNLDFVLIMTVNPGFGGQKFIPECADKIDALAAYLQHQRLELPIEVDGGVRPDNIADLRARGARWFVAGNAVFGTDNPRRAVQRLNKLIQG